MYKGKRMISQNISLKRVHRIDRRPATDAMIDEAVRLIMTKKNHYLSVAVGFDIQKLTKHFVNLPKPSIFLLVKHRQEKRHCVIMPLI